MLVEMRAELPEALRHDRDGRLRIGEAEPEAQTMEPVLEAVQVVDIVLASPLDVRIVEAVLQLFELAPEVPRLAHDGRAGRRVAAHVLTQGLLGVLELGLEAHDAVQRFVERGERVAPLEARAQLRRKARRLPGHERVGLDGDRDRSRATARHGSDRVGARYHAWTAHAPERILLFLCTRGPLEGEPRRPRVAEVPYEPAHALLPVSGRVHHDG